jgi:subtilisin family serine protease
VDHLKAAGVVVVVSAGNSGSQCHTVSTPAAIFENSFTVGATRQTDTIANFSSRGTVTVDSSNRLKPNIAAPGVGVRSSIRNGGFATFSGTSMAGPHVAGAVALLISANPELAGQVEAIEELLESTARPMRSDQDCGGVSGMEVPNAVYGYGRMDILAAVQETVSTSSQGTIPTAQALHAAPNPARETVLLTSVMPPAAPATVQWFDAQGRLIKTVNWPAMTTQLEVDIRDLPKGVYIVQARMGRALFSTRVVRQ